MLSNSKFQGKPMEKKIRENNFNYLSRIKPNHHHRDFICCKKYTNVKSKARSKSGHIKLKLYVNFFNNKDMATKEK